MDRYLKQFEKHDPSVAILGDAYTPGEARVLNSIVNDLRDVHPYKEYVIVPKCPAAFDIIDDDTVLGYAMGYSDVKAWNVAPLTAWRGRRIHLLGASPHKQYDVIEALTQPTLTAEPPADVVGLDWNGIQKVAYLGEYWSLDGWQRADHLSIRETVRRSLQEIKWFWEDRGVWPETEPIELYGSAVQQPDDPVYAVNGDDLTTREQLEDSIIVEYANRGKIAYRTETERRCFEYSEGLPEFWKR